VECSAGKKVAAAFKRVKAAIRRNHGLMTASRHSIDSAAFWFIALEHCRQQQLMIEATGRPPVLVPPERARCSREHVGSDYIAWLHFQPIHDRLVQTERDMFE
jgi:ribulose-5-phosphate 4-epimerase/fuculose-1-phosphate aldolase